MYRRELPGQTKLGFPFFNVELNPESKWVIMSDLMPWDRIEEEYLEHFRSNEGQTAKSARLAFGALYIQASEGLTDDKTRENIMENHHMQYFCGFTSSAQWLSGTSGYFCISFVMRSSSDQAMPLKARSSRHMEMRAELL